MKHHDDCISQVPSSCALARRAKSALETGSVDALAWEELFKRHYSRSVRNAGAIVGQNDAEDIAQDAWRKALTKIEMWDEKLGCFVSWFFTIVANTARDFDKRPKRIKLETDLEGANPDGGGQSILDVLVPTIDWLEEQIADEEQKLVREGILRAWRRLEWKCQVLLELAKNLGLLEEESIRLLKQSLGPKPFLRQIGEHWSEVCEISREKASGTRITSQAVGLRVAECLIELHRLFKDEADKNKLHSPETLKY